MDAIDCPIELFLPGVPDLLPALIVGFPLRDDYARRIDAAPRPARWLMHLSHQTGGYACGHVDVLGLALPLAANRRRLGDGAARALRAFAAMAEDPDYALLEREFPQVRPLVGTFGEPYDHHQLRALRTFLEPTLSLALVGGEEAWVRTGLAPADLLGWSCYSLGVCSLEGGWTTVPLRLDDFTLTRSPQRFTVDTRAVFDRDGLALLTDVGRRFDLRDLAVHLAWNNSD